MWTLRVGCGHGYVCTAHPPTCPPCARAVPTRQPDTLGSCRCVTFEQITRLNPDTSPLSAFRVGWARCGLLLFRLWPSRAPVPCVAQTRGQACRSTVDSHRGRMESLAGDHRIQIRRARCPSIPVRVANNVEP